MTVEGSAEVDIRRSYNPAIAARARLVFALVVVIGAAALRAQPADDPRALAARAGERIRALQQEADALAAEARSLFNELRKLELDRAIAQQQVAGADATLAAVVADHAAAVERLSKLEAARVAGTPGLTERVVSIYRRGRGGYARLLLSSDDPRAFGRLTRGVAAVAALDRMRVDAHRRLVDAERGAVAELEGRRTDVETSQRAADQARRSLDRAVQARNAAIDGLDARRDLAARYVAELSDAQARLQNAVTSAGSTPLELPFQPFQGELDWPVAGRVATRFGPGRDDRFATAVVRNGIEIEAAEGTAVRAIHGGVVAHAAPFPGFGSLVILDHGGGAFTMYGHLGEARVERGARVPRLGVVGTVGVAPAGEAALYFELRIDGRPADPLQWLRSSP